MTDDGGKKTGRINDEVEELPEKAKQINENPNLIIGKVFDILPVTMFISRAGF